MIAENLKQCILNIIPVVGKFIVNSKKEKQKNERSFKQIRRRKAIHNCFN